MFYQIPVLHSTVYQIPEVGLAEYGLAEYGLAEYGLADSCTAEYGLAEYGLARYSPPRRPRVRLSGSNHFGESAFITFTETCSVTLFR